MPVWLSKPEWLSAIGTVSAVVIALFLETARTFWNRPRLELTIRMGRPDCMKTLISDHENRPIADCYWFRVMVHNRGRGRANRVEIHAERLDVVTEGSFGPVEEFPPMRLLWSHVRQPEQDISPGVRKHCDLGYIKLPRSLSVPQTADLMLGNGNRFTFELEVIPNHGGCEIGAGHYRLHLAMAAANGRVQRIVLGINYSGQWTPKEADMFADQIRINVDTSSRRQLLPSRSCYSETFIQCFRANIDILIAVSALIAGIFWLLSACRSLPVMSPYWDQTPGSDPFFKALIFSAHMNQWAAGWSWGSAWLMACKARFKL
jgi:hypothetical protein